MRNYQVQGNLFKQESRLCEFLTIISPSADVKKKVSQFKAEFGGLFGSFNSQLSIAHVTVCDFLLFEHRTYDAFSLFKSRLEKFYPFELNIRGFGAFPGSNTIHLEVGKSPGYQFLLNEVDITRQMLRLRKNYFQSNTPHITVAKNISSEIFTDAKEIFLPREYSDSFTVTGLDVLKFDFITRRYQLFGHLPFKGRG